MGSNGTARARFAFIARVAGVERIPGASGVGTTPISNPWSSNGSAWMEEAYFMCEVSTGISARKQPHGMGCR